MLRKTKPDLQLTMAVFVAGVLLATFCPRTVAAPDKDTWAGIELGGSGVKLVVLKITQDAETARVELKTSDSTPAEITKNAKPGERLSAPQLTRATDALEDMLKIARRHDVPDDHVYLLISSGVAGLNAPNMDDLLAKIEGLIKIKDSGRLVMVKTAQEEVQYTIETVIDRKDRDDIMYVDIGGGNTKFGTMTKDGKVTFGSVKFGTNTLTTEARLKFAEPGFVAAIQAQRPKVVAAITQQVRDNKLTIPRTIYLGGGASWTMAVLQKQWTGGQAPAKVDPAEIDDFAHRMQTDKADPYTFKGGTKDVNKEQGEALVNIRDAFREPEKMVSASAMLQFVSEGLGLKDSKQVYFVPDSHLKWIEGFILKKQIGDKKLMWVNPKKQEG